MNKTDWPDPYPLAISTLAFLVAALYLDAHNWVAAVPLLLGIVWGARAFRRPR